MKAFLKFFLFTFLLGSVAVYWYGRQIAPIEEREGRAQGAGSQPIHIGIAWPHEQRGDAFIKGAQLAVQEYNSHLCDESDEEVCGAIQMEFALADLSFLEKLKYLWNSLNDASSEFSQNFLQLFFPSSSPPVKTSFYRKIKLHIKDDEESVLAGKDAAAEFVDNPDLIAVLGHPVSNMAVAVAPFYESNGVVFLSMETTYSHLTNGQFNYIFRYTPDNNILAQNLFQYAKTFRNVFIFKERELYSEELANLFQAKIRADRQSLYLKGSLYLERDAISFRRSLQNFHYLAYEQAATEKSMRITANELRNLCGEEPFSLISPQNQQYFEPELSNFCKTRDQMNYASSQKFHIPLKNLLNKFCQATLHNRTEKRLYEKLRKNCRLEAIFITGSMPRIQTLVQQLWDANVKVPIILGRNFLSKEFIAFLQQGMQSSVIAPLVSDPRSAATLQEAERLGVIDEEQPVGNLDFIKNVTPMVTGYQSMKILLEAIAKAQSTEPKKIAEILRFNNLTTDPLKYHFDMKGDIMGRQYTVVDLRTL